MRIEQGRGLQVRAGELLADRKNFIFILFLERERKRARATVDVVPDSCARPRCFPTPDPLSPQHGFGLDCGLRRQRLRLAGCGGATQRLLEQHQPQVNILFSFANFLHDALVCYAHMRRRVRGEGGVDTRDGAHLKRERLQPRYRLIHCDSCIMSCICSPFACFWMEVTPLL